MKKYIILISILLCIIFFFAQNKIANSSTDPILNENKEMKTTIYCNTLPDFPIEGGISAPFTGIIGNKLIVAGGCNFPDKPASAGGTKIFYSEVFAFDIAEESTNGIWKKCENMPYEVAYGASVTTPKGLVCIGGQNKDGSLTKVTLIEYKEDSENVIFTELPQLPTGLFNGGAALIGSTIYVTGGVSTHKTKGFVFTLDLEKSDEGWKEFFIPSAYERQQPVVVAQNGQLFVGGGYDEANATVFTDVIKYNPKEKKWNYVSEIGHELNHPKTLVGAAGVSYSSDKILFIGGVNYERFSSALKRIQNTKKAIEDGNIALADSLKLVGKEYMNQPIDWYKFETQLMSFDVKTNNWEILGELPQLARTGAGVAFWKNKIYIVCGELKPGIRTAEVNCIAIK